MSHAIENTPIEKYSQYSVQNECYVKGGSAELQNVTDCMDGYIRVKKSSQQQYIEAFFNGGKSCFDNSFNVLRGAVKYYVVDFVLKGGGVPPNP